MMTADHYDDCRSSWWLPIIMMTADHHDDCRSLWWLLIIIKYIYFSCWPEGESFLTWEASAFSSSRWPFWYCILLCKLFCSFAFCIFESFFFKWKQCSIMSQYLLFLSIRYSYSSLFNEKLFLTLQWNIARGTTDPEIESVNLRNQYKVTRLRISSYLYDYFLKYIISEVFLTTFR